MEDQPKCTWIGASSTRYDYYIMELSFSFSPDQDGNYIYAKKNADGLWVPVYIGQGDLKERTDNHHQASCIANKGATHIHAHLNRTEADRLEEEQDLLANFTQAYTPEGCNVKKGG